MSRQRCEGFTLIELLVTLVLLGLITSVVAPGIESWVASRQIAAERDALKNELAGLPLKASVNSKSILITSKDQLSMVDVEIAITEPIIVLANGYCVGGSFELVQGGLQHRFLVKQPLCDTERVP